MVVVDGIVI